MVGTFMVGFGEGMLGFGFGFGLEGLVGEGGCSGLLLVCECLEQFGHGAFIGNMGNWGVRCESTGINRNIGGASTGFADAFSSPCSVKNVAEHEGME